MAYRLEHPVAHLSFIGSLGNHQRLVHQTQEKIHNLPFVDVPSCPHRRSCLQGPPARENRETTKQSPLLLTKQIVAPIHRPPQRPLPGVHRSATAAQQLERVLESLGDLL